VLVDHAAERRRDEDVALDAEQVVGADHLDAGELGECSALADVSGQVVAVDALLAVDRARRV
jgi:hypothetical protein